MIITRTPLRISFVGGGSDLPNFYRNFGGAVISTTIDRYLYINVHKSFNNQVRVAYSKVEEAACFSGIEHPLVRNAAKLMNIETGLEITSIADIPSKGSGLGSSSSFSVGLLHALGVIKKQEISRTSLAESACKLEIQMCEQPIGKQDQYAASFGGLNIFEFKSDDSVITTPVELTAEIEHLISQYLMIFYTGSTEARQKYCYSKIKKFCKITRLEC